MTVEILTYCKTNGIFIRQAPILSCKNLDSCLRRKDRSVDLSYFVKALVLASMLLDMGL